MRFSRVFLLFGLLAVATTAVQTVRAEDAEDAEEPMLEEFEVGDSENAAEAPKQPPQMSEEEIDAVDAGLTLDQREGKMRACTQLTRAGVASQMEEMKDTIKLLTKDGKMKEADVVNMIAQHMLMGCYFNIKAEEADVSKLTDERKEAIMNRSANTPQRFSKVQQEVLQKVLKETQPDEGEGEEGEDYTPPAMMASSWSSNTKLLWTLGIFAAFFGAALVGLRKLTAIEEGAGKKAKKDKKEKKRA